MIACRKNASRKNAIRCFIAIVIVNLYKTTAWYLPTPHHVSGAFSISQSSSLSSPPSSLYTRRSELYMGQRGKRIRRERRRVLQDPTPPRIVTPYGPIRLNKPPRVCDTCSGRGLLRCDVCEGRGVIRKTGQRKTNPVRVDRLLSSRWTSVETRHGHRQYRVVEIKGSIKQKKELLQVRMVNCCGEDQVTDFWIPMAELQNKMMWRMGWTTLEEIRQADGGALLDVRFCFRCKGQRIYSCLDCDGKGKIESLEPLYD